MVVLKYFTVKFCVRMEWFIVLSFSIIENLDKIVQIQTCS